MNISLYSATSKVKAKRKKMNP